MHSSSKVDRGIGKLPHTLLIKVMLQENSRAIVARSNKFYLMGNEHNSMARLKFVFLLSSY